MALWHDPLDDLIEQLEKTIPQAPASALSDAQGLLGMPLEEVQWMVADVLYGQRAEPLIIETEAIAAAKSGTPRNDADE